MRAILLLQVDSDEQTPIGVYPGLLEARDAMVEDATRDRPMDEAAEVTEDCLANFQRELDSVRRTDDDTLDIQFESGAGSWDYRLVYVSVHGA
jgi:hypothetical protein